MSEPSRQSVRGLTLAVLIPCLLFSAALAGWVTYRDLYRVILNHGFERKLLAVSTAVAAFVDGGDHLELSRLSRVTGVAADPERPVLWGLDTLNRRLVTVDLATGGANDAGPLPFPEASALAFDALSGRLVTVTPAGELVAFEPGRPESVPLGSIEAGAHSLALDGTGTRLVTAGPWGIRGYVRGSASAPFTSVWSSPERALAVAVSPTTGTVFALLESGALLTADTVGGALTAVGVPRAEDGDPAVLGQVRGLAASSLTTTLFGTAERRLVGLSPEEGTFHQERFRRGYRSEGDPRYQRYVQPMRRIRSTLDITYLYTQNLTPGDSVQYIVDSTPGEAHSPIGGREALETESDIRGLAAVMDRGVVYSSGIENSEEWGLLKSAYAPILGPQGTPVGMAGTDISVSTIQDRTQLALAKVGLVTVVILFLGGLGSVAISHRLTGPLAAVQEGASKVAAGHVGRPLEPPRLQELADLTTSFNEMTETLTSSVSELKDEIRRVSATRVRRHIVQELAGRMAAREPLPEGLEVHAPDLPASVPATARLAVAARVGGPVVAASLRPLDGDPLALLAEREELAVLLRRLAAGGDTGVEELMERLARLWGVGEPLLLVAAGDVVAAPGTEVGAVLETEGAAAPPRTLPGGRVYRVPAGGRLLVAVPGVGEDGRGGAWTLEVRGRGA